MNEIRVMNLTIEAKDEFREICGYDFPLSAKEEINFYLQRQPYLRNYFKLKHIDKLTDKELYLFFYRGNNFGEMQVYDLRGICEAENWTEDLEDDGQIRAWLMTTYDCLQDEEDWVETWRQKEIEKLIGELENEYSAEYYRTEGVIAKLPQIHQAIAGYLSEPSQEWETFAENIRRLTGENGFGKYGNRPTRC